MTGKIGKKFILCFLCLGLIAPTYSQTGNIYYVDTNGLGGAPSDSNNCTSITTPCKTIQAAFNKGTAPGSTIYLREGEYYEDQLTYRGSGSPGNWVTIQSYPGETATIVGAKVYTGSWTQDSGYRYRTSPGWSPSTVVAVCPGQPEQFLSNYNNASAADVDGPGQWWNSGGTVYVWMPGNAIPNTCSVRMSRYSTGIYGETSALLNIRPAVNASHVRVQNLTLKYAANQGLWFSDPYGGAERSQFGQVKNVVFAFIRGAGTPRFNRWDYGLAEGNTIYDVGIGSEGPYQQEAIQSYWSDYTVIKDNLIYNSYGIGIIPWNDADENLVIGNTIHTSKGLGPLGNGAIYCDTCYRTRIQNNLIYNWARQGFWGDAGLQINAESATYNSTSKNLSKYNTWIGNIVSKGYFSIQNYLNNYQTNIQRINNNYYGHNTTYNAKAIELRPGYGAPYNDYNFYKNNIFFGSQANPTKIVEYVGGTYSPNNDFYDYNLHFSAGGNTRYTNKSGTGYTNSSGLAAFNWWASQPGVAEDNSIYGNPLFVDPSSNNFALQASSPAKDAGGALTTTVAAAGTCTAASSVNMKVVDSNWFHGGWGNDGAGNPIVAGDSLRIKGTTTDQIRTVSSVDWTNHIITFTAVLSCQANDGVGFAAHWKGSQPDMGAKEYETAGTTLSGDLNNDLKVDIKDIQLCVRVILGIETDLKIIQRAKEVALPLDKADIKDIQGIVKIILGG